MFVPEKGLFMHGWVQDITEHPAFFWGRANGWAIMTLAETLEVYGRVLLAGGKMIAMSVFGFLLSFPPAKKQRKSPTKH